MTNMFCPRMRHLGVLLCLLFLGACQPGDLASKAQAAKAKGQELGLVLAAIDWPEARFFNAYFGFILREGFGYRIAEREGSDAGLYKALKNRQIDLHLTLWKQGFLPFEEAVAAGQLLEVGELYSSARQGYYVPTYMIRGDASRGIAPLAPDLRTVADLARYAPLFAAVSERKPRFVSAPLGWLAAEATAAKFTRYGLDQAFELERPHSARELEESLLSAYASGQPWVGYYWEPGWIWADHDLTLLQEPDYDQQRYRRDFSTAFPLQQVVIAAQPEFRTKAPDAYAFLQRFQADVAWVSEVLGELHDSGLSADQLAQRKLREQPELWLPLLPEPIALKVLAALEPHPPRSLP